MPSVTLTTLLYIARSGMSAQETNISVIANNLANMNTTGFKYSRAGFQELLDTEIAKPSDGSNRAYGEAAGVALTSNQRILTQGQIQLTDYQWDMAIEGEGFFQVQLRDGTTAYTRDGSFHLDGDGHLTTTTGLLVMPQFTIPPDAEDILINPDGNVLVRRRGETDPRTVGTIQLARFADPAGMSDIGRNLFTPDDASGAVQVVQPGTNGMGQILSFALESSNVDLSQQMVDLITSQRAYTLMSQVIETTDEMLGIATQMRSG